MTLKAYDIITEAMKAARIYDPDETPSEAEMAHNLGRLNRLLDMWALERLTLNVRTEDIKVLTYGQGSYTIGENGTPDISSVRPIKIEDCFLRDTASSNTDYPVGCTMTQDQYNAITIKNQIAVPTRLYYHPSVPNGTIYFNFAPDRAFEAHFFSSKAITAFADLYTEYDFAPGYESVLVSNLATKIANDYGREITAEMKEEAVLSLSYLKSQNKTSGKLSCFLVPTANRSGSGRFNILTGE